MSVQTIVSFLDKLTQLHESLLEISHLKTEKLKAGEIDSLQELIKQEQKHVQAINQVELKRIEAVEGWAKSHQLNPNEMTVSMMIESHVEGTEKDKLEKVTLKLAEVLVTLRAQEELNRQLTEQSLQFVRFSIDMIQPSIKNINYGNTKKSATDQSTNRSVFDSKA
ncbi:flagellar protein FlgN [Saliterribacillus persicus]|uniref:FlgN protein n=1 Tax=Saliterribacillus persicus TaxID=930114 RepID=A0A368Y4S0_9BACI|nr:flagellar protein FlgN [Saliterribacillus persicus]RCW74729.1 FlgN protein [Saliterribacillus persicus]